MRASDHFYTELDVAARRNRGSIAAAAEEASHAFGRLVVPTVGEEVADEFFNWWLERYGSGENPRWEKLGHIGAFVLGEYDGATMDLDHEDWEAIRDVVSAAGDELDLDVLSQLMTELVSHGVLD